MSKMIFTITLASCLLAATAWADPEDPDHPRLKSKEWTDHHDSDGGISKTGASAGARLSANTTTRDSVVPELSEIVVLCATEQEKQFEKEWKQYVDKNELKEPELSETIAWVSKEAASQRMKEGKIKSKKDEEAWARKRGEFMREVANKALNPAR